MAKRICALLICLLICLPLCSPCAQAVQDHLSFMKDDEFFATHSGFPQGGCAVGDALYLFTDRQIYILREGDGSPTAIDCALPKLEGETRRLLRLFTDGERLMALLGVYGFDEGEYEGLIALEVGKVDIGMGIASFGEALEIDSDGLIVDHGYPELTALNAAVCASGHLFIDAYDENYERELIAIELSSGESGSIDVDKLSGIAAYDGERLLLETFDADAGQAQFFIYDPEDDSAVPACDPLQSDTPISCFAWSAASSRLFWLDRGYVKAARGFDIAAGEAVAEIAARFPDEAEAFLMQNDRYALISRTEGIFLRSTDPGALPETQIVVQGGGLFRAMMNGYHDFNASHDDATAVLREVYDDSDVLAQIMSRDDSVDVRVMMSSNETFTALLERGLLAPIDSQELADAVEELYPAIREALSIDGQLMAVPIYADGTTLGLDIEGFEFIGIPREELPDNWLDFLDLLPTLPERLDEDGRARIFPESLTQPQLRAELIAQILESWLLYLRANDLELRYDDPDLRAALEKVMALDMDALGVKPGRDDSYAEISIAISGIEEAGARSYTLVLPSVDCSLSKLSYYEPALLSVIPGTRTPLSLDLAVLYINPYSRHIELAQEYIADVYNELQITDRYDLSGALNEPLEDASYASAIAAANQALEDAQAKLEASGPEDAPRWEQAVEDAEATRASIEAKRWRISKEAIEWYHAQAENMLVRSYNYVDPSDAQGEFYDLIQQFLSGKTDAADFLKEIDRRVQMKAREG